MNTKNNKRRRESIELIEKAFIELLQSQEFRTITVSDICKMTGLNRSTFYANFEDIYDLGDKLRDKLESSFALAFPTAEAQDDLHDGALRMFRHIYDNQLLYRTYFKLGYDEQFSVLTYDHGRASADFGNAHIAYHIEFFRCGFNALVKLWLRGGCKESPETMAEILKQEYRGR